MTLDDLKDGACYWVRLAEPRSPEYAAPFIAQYSNYCGGCWLTIGDDEDVRAPVIVIAHIPDHPPQGDGLGLRWERKPSRELPRGWAFYKPNGFTG